MQGSLPHVVLVYVLTKINLYTKKIVCKNKDSFRRLRNM